MNVLTIHLKPMIAHIDEGVAGVDESVNTNTKHSLIELELYYDGDDYNE